MSENTVVDIIEGIVKGIVDNPGDVKIKEEKTEKTVLIDVEVPREDVGKVIGKKGNMARALRTICAALSGKHDMKYLLQIIE